MAAKTKTQSDMRTIKELPDVLRELAENEAAIKPLIAQNHALNTERRKLESLEFIEVNSITKSDVEMSAGDGKPWFGTVHSFIGWLKNNHGKPWAEWNGVIYRSRDLIMSHMPEMPGRTDDLK